MTESVEQLSETVEKSVEVYNKYMDMAIQYGTEYGLKVIGALLIFIIGKMIANSLGRLTERVMQKYEVDHTLTEFARSTVYFVLLVVVVIAALGNLGINTTSFMAILGAAGLAIGLALKIFVALVVVFSLMAALLGAFHSARRLVAPVTAIAQGTA